MRALLKGNKAMILIVALWIVAILTVFAVSTGRRSAICLKLTSYNIDRLKAYFIARAGILRALAEKEIEYKAGRSATIDALSQNWANNKELFKDRKFGDGSYTISYKYPDSDLSGEEPPTFYGLMDEQCNININTAPPETIANLLALFEVDRDNAEEIAVAVIDWRDEDSEVTSSYNESYLGAEDDYYQGLLPAYHCKNLPFDTIYELLLVRGITSENLKLIKPYITIYGEGKVNINTANDVALNALFGPVFPDLASKIINYRNGNDEIAGTEDDRWFSLGSYIIDRAEKGLVEIKNLQDAEWYANIYGITTEEYNRIKELVTGEDPQLCVSSKAYRAVAAAEVKKVKAKIEAVYLFEKKNKPPKVAFWYQEQ